MGILDMMSISQKLQLTNAIHAFLKPEKPFVKKSFPNAQTADNTVTMLSAGVPREDLIRLMKSIRLPQSIIDELPTVPKPVAAGQPLSVVAASDPNKYMMFSPDILKQITPKQKLVMFNLMHKHIHGPEHKPVKKFKDVALADTNLNCVAKNFTPIVVAGFMEKAKCDAALVEKIKAPKPIDISAHKTKKREEEQADAKPPRTTPIRHETNPKKPNKLRLSFSAQRVLAAIQNLIPADLKPVVKGKKKIIPEVDSTRVAEYLKTSIRCVCQTITHDLFPSGLVTYEDDSPDTGVEFLYIRLTPAGRQFEVDPNSGTFKLPAPAPGPKSKFSGPSTGKANKGDGVGRNSSIGDKRIYKVVKDNPRKPGTHGWKSFEALKDGMTYGEYKSAGGRNNDLNWDIAHNYVEVR